MVFLEWKMQSSSDFKVGTLAACPYTSIVRGETGHRSFSNCMSPRCLIQNKASCKSVHVRTKNAFLKVPFWNRSKTPYGARQYRQSLKSDSQGLTEFHCSGVYNKVVSLTVVGLWPSGAQNECPWRSYSGWSIFHQCLEIHTYRQGPFPEESWQSAEAWKTVFFAQIN